MSKQSDRLKAELAETKRALAEAEKARGELEKALQLTRGRSATNVPNQQDQNQNPDQSEDDDEPKSWRDWLISRMTIKKLLLVALAGDALINHLSDDRRIYYLIAALITVWLFWEAFEAHRQVKRKIFYIVSISSAVLWVLTVTWVRSQIRATDPLLPANEPMPLLPRGHSASEFPADSLFFFAGSNVTVIPKNNLIPLFIGHGRVLLEAALTNGNMYVNGRFFDSMDRIIVKIENNVIIQGDSFNPKRPDRSTFIVSDRSDVEVLNIRYLNASAFRITGLIRSSNCVLTITKSNAVINSPFAKNIKHSGNISVGRSMVDFDERGIKTFSRPNL